MKADSCMHNCFEVLGNELRFNILKSLKEKPKTVRELCKELKREQSAVSHALKTLRRCKFVDYKQKGKEREYCIKCSVFDKKRNQSLIEIGTRGQPEGRGRS